MFSTKRVNVDIDEQGGNLLKIFIARAAVATLVSKLR